MSNEEAKTMLITMLGLLTIACGDAPVPMAERMAEAVDIATTAIDMQEMKIENKENQNE